MFGLMKKTSIVLALITLMLGIGPGISHAITWTPNFTSSTHTLSQSSTSDDVTVSWDAMTPTGGATADSYTYVWDNTSNTDITASKTPTETISGNLSGLTVTRTLTSGTWYLHMRAVDSGGDWTETQHFGPIIVDTQPVPTVTAISPTSGSNGNSTVDVTITGQYFKKLDDSDFNSVSAKIGTTTLSNITVASATSITATYAILDKTAEAKDVTVITDWGTSSPLSGGFTVSNPAPTVTAISPTSAANDVEKDVTITGTGFLSTSSTPAESAAPTVQLVQGGTTITLTSVTWVSKTSLTATVPSGKAVGTYDLVVTNSDGQSDTLTDAFELKLPAPTLSSVSPASGTNDASTTITLTGTNFATSGGTPQVTLEADGKDAIAGTSVSVSDATSMTAVVPADPDITGVYSVKVTNPDGQNVTKTEAFTINNPIPTITSITPSTMTNTDTQAVTIVGTKFRSGIKVTIGTTEATGVSLDGDNPTTTLTCTVPANIDAGTYDVILKNEGVTTTGSKTDGFTVNAAVTTASVAYSASDSSKVPAGDLTITATFTQSQSSAPKISIDLPGVTTDVSSQDMSATSDDKVWEYTYTVNTADGSSYEDGSATVTIASSGGSNISITSGSTFTINTVALSATVTYAQGSNTSGPFKAGDLTITVTFNVAVTNPPKISIDQQGSTDVTNDNTFTGPGASNDWTFTYTINAKDGTNYKDGTATVSLKNTDDADADIPIGSGGSFSIDTTAPTVALTYSHAGGKTTSPFAAGVLTITATFSEVPDGTPQIALTQAGTAAVSATNMSAGATSKIFTYPYTVTADNGSEYEDGTATVTITNGADSAGNDNAAATNNTFTIDTKTTVSIDAVTTPTATASQTITGTMEDGATVALTVTSPVTAGTVTYPTSTTWQATVSNLPAQSNTITATATDALGNTAQAQTAIEYDPAPQVASATYVDTTHVDVTFDEAVTGADSASRYTISGLTISAVADQTNNTYRLTTSEMTAGQTYTVVVSSAVVDSLGTGIDSAHNSADYVTGVKGDVNNDGSKTIDDVKLAFQFFLGLQTPSSAEFYAADANDGDGSLITIDDVKGVFLIFLGL